MKIFNPFKKKKIKKRKYEGASKGKRLENWITGSRTSADSQIAPDLPTLRERSRDLRRNNPYASKAIQVISNNVVGKGIQTQFSVPDENLDNNIERRWKAWAHSTVIDFDGQNDIFGLQKLIMEAVAESGEVLIRRRFSNDGGEIPIQYQVLEPDFLNTSILRQDLENGNSILQGIEIDSDGRRVAYHLYNEHPGSLNFFGVNSLASSRIPSDLILHIYRKDRPGQMRGVPWAAPSMVRIKDLDDYEDAELMRQKVAACFSAFVHDINEPDEDEDCEDLGERIEPGRIEFLPPGKTVEFSNPPVNEGYKSFATTVLHSIAAGYGITYEDLTGDYSETNYSSGRMGWIAFHRNVEAWRHGIMINGFLNPVVDDFLLALEIMGINTETVSHKHTPPRRELIDPSKEIPGIINKVRAGLSSLSSEIAAQGEDPVKVFDQIQKDNEKMDELGITLDSDPRKVGGNGNLQGGGSTDENQNP